MMGSTYGFNERIADVRRKCFLSYQAVDGPAVTTFLLTFGDVFIPKVIGVTDADDFIDSDNSEYVMRRIREKYLSDSTVTILMIGACTWGRKYIDWEIASTLRNDPINGRSGLMGIRLAMGVGKPRPPRLDANLAGADGDEGYARSYVYPSSKAVLRTCIEDAYAARSSRARLIVNNAPLKRYNSPCP
jgi:hypothetical protein